MLYNYYYLLVLPKLYQRYLNANYIIYLATKYVTNICHSKHNSFYITIPTFKWDDWHLCGVLTYTVFNSTKGKFLTWYLKVPNYYCVTKFIQFINLWYLFSDLFGNNQKDNIKKTLHIRNNFITNRPERVLPGLRETTLILNSYSATML